MYIFILHIYKQSPQPCWSSHCHSQNPPPRGNWDANDCKQTQQGNYTAGGGGKGEQTEFDKCSNFAIIFGQDCSCCVSPLIHHYNYPVMDFCISKTFSLDLKEPLSSIIISSTKTNANLYLSNAITELQIALCRRFNRIRESWNGTIKPLPSPS